MSSHLGDEFVLAHPGLRAIELVARRARAGPFDLPVRDGTCSTARSGWAFHSEISEPWEFQLGLDWAPTTPTGFHGAPFFAINGHLRQEVDYSGNLSVMTGWAWMSDRDRHLLRIGVHYYNGKSSQYSFYDDFESQVGAGIWYDF